MTEHVDGVTPTVESYEAREEMRKQLEDARQQIESATKERDSWEAGWNIQAERAERAEKQLAEARDQAMEEARRCYEPMMAEARQEGMREAITKLRENLTSGRAINNFHHVPEAVRALEWALMDFNGAAEELERPAAAQKGGQPEISGSANISEIPATGATSAEGASAGVAQEDTTRPCPAGKHLVFVWPSGRIVPHFAADGKKCEASHRMYADV